MKIRWIGIMVVVLWLVGVAIITRSFVQQEEDERIRDILNKGDHLVSLIALYPTQSFEGDQRDFFLRTLTEYTSREGLVYLLVHDLTRHRIVSLAPKDLLAKIPKNIEISSLYATGLTQQTYKLNGSELTIYEFAKPIYESGQRTGTVRLGLKLPAVSVFSAKRISLLAMVAFFIFATLLCGYYGITLVLRPLKNLNEDFQGTIVGSASAGTGLMKDVQIAPMVKNVEQSLIELKDKLNKIEQDNMALASKLGVLSFEKKQIVNILNSLDLGIIITDIQDNIIHINNFMLTLLNRTLEDAVDRPLGEVVEYDKIIAFIAQGGALGNTRSRNYIETTFPTRDPEETFQVSLSHLSDDGGAVIGKIILVRNVSKEKTVQKANYEFITHVAHELRTPLTTIKSYNEMLMSGEIDDEETQKEFYNTINEETDRVARLIENLLNVSKIEMGSLSLHKTLTKTDRLFKDCVGAIEALAHDKHITIEKNVPDKFPSLFGDKELLKVALINFLSNAVKYTPETGTIVFVLAEQDNAIVFDVIDTGCGISKEDIPRIFDKFYRSEDSKVTEQTGSGLGLAIASEIIHLHGGKIEVQSELGNGTHFTITVPKEQYYLEEQ